MLGSMQGVLLEIARSVDEKWLVRLPASKGGGIALPWHAGCVLMDARAPGWSYSIIREGVQDVLRGNTSDGYKPIPAAWCIVQVTVPCEDGVVTRQAFGCDDEPTNQRGLPYQRAEANGLCRAFAKFGLALDLYGGEAAKARVHRLGLQSATDEGGYEQIVALGDENDQEAAPDAGPAQTVVATAVPEKAASDALGEPGESVAGDAWWNKDGGPRLDLEPIPVPYWALSGCKVPAAATRRAGGARKVSLDDLVAVGARATIERLIVVTECKEGSLAFADVAKALIHKGEAG